MLLTELLSVCVSGSKFLSSVLVAPVKNENNEVILFILNFEDITDAPVKSDSYRNSLKNSKSPVTWYLKTRPVGVRGSQSTKLPADHRIL